MARTPTSDSIIKLRPAELIRELRFRHQMLQSTGARWPIMVYGSPGIGKSDIIRHTYEDLGYRIIDTRIAYYKAGDWGFPIPTKRIESRHVVDPETGDARDISIEKVMGVQWARPDFFPRGDEPTVWFFDELSAARQYDQLMVYELFVNFCLADYQVPKNTILIAAGNKISDKAIAYKLPSALANRMGHCELEVNPDDWIEWAFSAGIHPDVTAYIGFDSGSLFDTFDYKSEAFPTPRSWERISKLLQAGYGDRIAIEMEIGSAKGREFMEFRRLRDKLPDLKGILEGKVKSIDESRSDLMWLVVTSLVSRLNEQDKDFSKHMDNLTKFFVDGLVKKDFGVLGLKNLKLRFKDDLKQRSKELQSLKPYVLDA